MIGAPNDDDNGQSSGSAYVYSRDGSGQWRETQKLIASDGSVGDGFGWAASFAGDKAVIGAPRDDDNDNRFGSAYVYSRDGSGQWRETQKLTASDGSTDDFGYSISLSMDAVMVGSPGNFDDDGAAYVFEINEPGNDLLTIEKRINHRVRTTPNMAAQLLAGTRYRANYTVSNNSSDRIYSVQVFDDNQLICNLYALNPGESNNKCASNQSVLIGQKSVPASVTALVSGSNQTISGQGESYYTGISNVSGQLTVRHYINNHNADTKLMAVQVNKSTAEMLFRVENTGSIELYRIKAYHDPLSPINSGWEQQCNFGTLIPGQVRYCKRTTNANQTGLNMVFGRAQGHDSNVDVASYVNASNPTYFNVTGH